MKFAGPYKYIHAWGPKKSRRDNHVVHNNNPLNQTITCSNYTLKLPVSKSIINKDYPSKPQNFGETLRRIRIDLNLKIKELAHHLNVVEDSIINWEHRNIFPSPKQLKKIIQFLNGKVEDSVKNDMIEMYFHTYPYYPKNQDSFGSQLRAIRMRKMLSIKELSTILNVDSSTIRKCETQHAEPSPLIKQKFIKWAEDNRTYS